MDRNSRSANRTKKTATPVAPAGLGRRDCQGEENTRDQANAENRSKHWITFFLK